MRTFPMKKTGQIWVETVLYTLIGLALIGIALALVTPKINEYGDRKLVEQSIASISFLDSKINEVLENGQGNIRKVDSFTLKKGELIINSSGEEIFLVLTEFTKPYSESGVEIEFGNVKLISESGQKKSSVKIKLSYSGIANLTYYGKEDLKKFNPSTIPYRFSFENKGINNSLTIIDVKEVSR